MKLGIACIVIGVAVEIWAASQLLATESTESATIVWHLVAATLCSFAGATVSAPIKAGVGEGASRSRAAFLLIYYVLAVLLPVGGVLTVLAMTLLLGKKPSAPREDAPPFEAYGPPQPAISSEAILETLGGSLAMLPLDRLRSAACGLRQVRPANLTAKLLQHLQLNEDTETRFRAQGAVARAIRPAEELLRHATSTDYPTRPHQKLAAADACLELADWTPATGANRQTLIENCIGFLDDDSIEGLPRLERLARAQLAAARPDQAAETIEQLKAAGASSHLSGPLEAELLFQQRDWVALAERCRALLATNPELSGVARFWRAAAAPR